MKTCSRCQRLLVQWGPPYAAYFDASGSPIACDRCCPWLKELPPAPLPREEFDRLLAEHEPKEAG